MKNGTLAFSLLLSFPMLFSLSVGAQERLVPVQYGDFEQWTTRNIKESAVLGGNMTTVYAIGPERTINGAKPYDSKGISPWGSSNVLAVVMGVTKTSTTVYPEKRDSGRCVRMDTKLVECKALGIINVAVTASGTIYLGRMMEPVKSTNNPYSKMDMGIKYTQRPKALQFDYKTILSSEKIITKATGVSTKTFPGDDYADIFIYLQKRWEDKDGNIFAKRVGTSREFFTKNIENWQNGHRMVIDYGDVSKKPGYKSYLGLRKEFYAQNSHGEMVPIQEVGWADDNDEPTHVILIISSGSRGAYEGIIGNSLWVDNVQFVF